MPTVTLRPARNADAIENALTAEKRAVPIGVKAAAKPIHGYITARVSTPYPPPSAPGTPAHRRTGKYMKGWKVKPKGVVLTITNSAGYSMFLERGTSKMKARPAVTAPRGGAAGGAAGALTSAAARKPVREAGRTAADTARRMAMPRTGGGGGGG